MTLTSTPSPALTRVGWIGTGVMGRWMCGHLMTKGFTATVYNRTKDKASRCSTGRAVGRHAQERGRAVRRGLRDRRLSRRRPRGVSRRRRRAGRQQGGQHPRRHDHQRAVAGVGDLRGGQAARRRQRRCAGLRRRRRRAGTRALDHGRRRHRRRRRGAGPCSRRWARRSSIKAGPAPASTPRWSIRS